MFALTPEEAVEVADALDNLRRDCETAVAQHGGVDGCDEADRSTVVNVSNRAQYLKDLESRIREFLEEKTGDTYGLKLKRLWKAAK